MTVAIWVGYPDKLVPMLTEYGGQPVAGRHLSRRCIWHNFMEQAMAILDQRSRDGRSAARGETRLERRPSRVDAARPAASRRSDDGTRASPADHADRRRRHGRAADGGGAARRRRR